MKKVFAVILFSVVSLFAADSLTISTIDQPQRIDTVKARLVAPSWRYDNKDTTYLKRNGFVWVRMRFVNPGSLVVVDTTVIWRPSDIGLDSYKFSPVLKLYFEQK